MANSTKRQFEQFKNQHSPIYIVKHAIKPRQLYCSCAENFTREGDYLCPKCLGTGHIYRSYRIKMRKTTQGSGGTGSLSTSKVDFDESIKISNQRSRFIHSIDEKIGEQDIIIEKTPDGYEFRIVLNSGFQIGDNGKPVYKETLTALIKNISKNFAKKILRNVRNELSLKTRIKKISLSSKTMSRRKIKSVVKEVLEEESIITKNNARNILYEKYDLKNVEEALDILLNTGPQIINFTSNKNNILLGNTVKNLFLSWQVRGQVQKQFLNNKEIDSSKNSYTFEKEVNNSSTFQLEVENENGKDSKKIEVAFINNIYYGSSSNNIFTVSNLEKIRTEKVDLNLNVNIKPGEYFYYLQPARLVQPFFRTGGIEGGISLIEQREIENEAGFTEKFLVYRSNNHSLGKVNIEVLSNV